MIEYDGCEPQDCDTAFIERHGFKWWAKALVFIWSMHSWERDDHVFYEGMFGEGEWRYHCRICQAKTVRVHAGGP